MSGRPNDPFGSQLRNNMSNSLGFSLRIPIFKQVPDPRQHSLRPNRRGEHRIEMDKVKIELRKRIEQAFHNAVGAQSKWKATRKSEISSQEAFRFAQEKFDNDRANAYELSQAKSNLTQVLSEQAQAKYEYAFRLKIVEMLKE